jgi:hypothetical protein
VATFRLLIAESVLATVRGYRQTDRREIARLLELIAADPWIDNRVKLAWLVPPVAYTVYASSRFWILYHVVSSDTVHVLNVGRSGLSEPTPW